MISECEEHGYYREESCPICGAKGRFIMSDYEVEKMGRTMAGILRHGKFGLAMDEMGFVAIQDIVDTVSDLNPRMKWLRPYHVEALVETDPKGRYQLLGHKVRATYGHTIKLDLRLPTDGIPAALFYPASPEERDVILETGILPSDRAMVHLSATYADAVRAGSVRVDEPAILEVDTAACAAAGYPIGRAAKTVYLCDQVPPACVKVAVPPAEPVRPAQDNGGDD